MSKADADVYNYLIQSLVGQYPKLAPFACDNHSIFELAKYLRRWTTSSTKTLCNYVYSVGQFSRWCGREPDELISECKTGEGLSDPKRLAEHSRLVEDFIGALMADGLAPGTISVYVKGVKALYQANELKLELPHRLKRTTRYEDRAPTPEELQRLLDLGGLREKVIVSCLALGGFREGTITKLEYRHVREDLEKGIVPVHVHIEAEITKGKYHDYDTFLGQEAVEFLKAYLDERRRGTLRVYETQGRHLVRAGIPPESIEDSSPLIRTERHAEPRPVTEKRIYDTVHSLYRRAGLIPQPANKKRRYYKLRVHSIRKFFRTQLASLGVDRDYIEYMMGHKVSTYHDIQMKGIEFLRGIYIASGVSIRPKTKFSKIEALKEIARAWGLNPEEILTREALAVPHRVYHEEDQFRALGVALRETLRKEVLDVVKGDRY